ncbi:MAG: PAS domain S-box protein [Desulfobacterales bacterium]
MYFHQILDPHTHIAFVGGGRFCRQMLEFLHRSDCAEFRPRIVGVADIDEFAPGMVYARELGIPVSDDYREFFAHSRLDVLVELSDDPHLAGTITRHKPEHVCLIDHRLSRALWDALQMERLKLYFQKSLESEKDDPEAVIGLSCFLMEKMEDILRSRNQRSYEIELELTEAERTLSQIIQGSTIPTFVIDARHIVTHWNRAMEQLTGWPADAVVGTNKQWSPFWKRERPTMADVILDQIDEAEIEKLYATKWRKSALIEDAYEAEVFFPKLGRAGKWCFFTAAPIKGPDGRIVGAIETLWDRTEDKKATEERERHSRESKALLAIYSALNAPTGAAVRIQAAIDEMAGFLEADGICIFLADHESRFRMHYSLGLSRAACPQGHIAGADSMIQRVAASGRFTLVDPQTDGSPDDVCLRDSPQLRSLAFIPIRTKENPQFGVIRIGSRRRDHFAAYPQRILELMGNRIGAAVENAMLQEQVAKSEEMYRSLFNNDPNPIFILDNETFTILDTNQRAQDCYGYSAREFNGQSFTDLGDSNEADFVDLLRLLPANQSALFPKKRHFRKDGQPLFVNINVVHTMYGEHPALIASTTDITETVEKETQLIQAGKMTTLGVMAAGMAHEINQPLNVIQICADYFLKMLKRGQPIPDQDLESLARDISANVQRATNVIRHVRDFARQSEVVRGQININAPIKDVFKVLGHQLKTHEIKVELNLDPAIAPILAEHNRLEQVFINLVSNAIDAMDERSSQADTTDAPKILRIETYSADNFVVAKVADTGMGMNQETQGKIFEPFFTTKKVGKGTGLGTSISYGIIKDYEGTIQVTSQLGQGTMFTLKFPALK